MKYLIYIIIIMFPTTLFGSQGRVYDIVEKDAILEIEEKAATIDWKSEFSIEKKEKILKNYKPKNLINLPSAKTDDSYLVDMTYTLDADLPDGKGGILYPKGYSFNPLNFMTYSGIIIVIDGTKQSHIDWFQKSKYKNSIKTKLLITDGNYYELAQQLRRPVFHAVKEIVTRFQLKKVPCVVTQVEKSMLVEEFAIEVH